MTRQDFKKEIVAGRATTNQTANNTVYATGRNTFAPERMTVEQFAAQKLKDKAFDTLYRLAPVNPEYEHDLLVMDVIRQRRVVTDTIIIRIVMRRSGLSEGEIIKSLARLKERGVIEEIPRGG